MRTSVFCYLVLGSLLDGATDPKSGDLGLSWSPSVPAQLPRKGSVLAWSSEARRDISSWLPLRPTAHFRGCYPCSALPCPRATLQQSHLPGLACSPLHPHPLSPVTLSMSDLPSPGFWIPCVLLISWTPGQSWVRLSSVEGSPGWAGVKCLGVHSDFQADAVPGLGTTNLNSSLAFLPV